MLADTIFPSVLSNQAVISLLGLTLLHFLWQGVLLGALYWVVDNHLQRNQRSSQARYLLAVVTQLLMAIIPVLWFCAGLQALTAQPSSDPSVFTRLITSGQEIAAAATSVSSADAPASSNTLMFWTVCLWLAGVLFYSTRLVLGALGLRDMTRKTATASAALQSRVDLLAAHLGLRTKVDLLLCSKRIIPATIGFLKPVIIMPACVVTRLTPSQLELIILHELAHIRRHDYLVNLLQLTVETLLFYHPVVRWVGKRARIEREHCCDDIVVAMSHKPLDYAYALTELETVRQDGFSTALAATGGDVVSRVRRMLQPQPMRRQRGFLASGMLLAAVAITGLVASSQYLEPGQSTEDGASLPINPPTPTVPAQEVLATPSTDAQLRPTLIEYPEEPSPSPGTPTKPLAQQDQAPDSVSGSPAQSSVSTPIQAQRQEESRPIATTAPESVPGPEKTSTSQPDEPAAETDSAHQPAVQLLDETLAIAMNVPRNDAFTGLTSTNSRPTPPLASEQPTANPDPITASQKSAGEIQESPGLKLRMRVDPQYPRSAMRRGLEGWVSLSVTVDADGHVSDIKVIETSENGEGFTDASIEAVNQWEFETHGLGQTTMMQTVEFTLTDAERQRFCTRRTGTRVNRC